MLILDEVEALMRTDEGMALIENLRIAYEQLSGRLAVVVLGGSMLKQLALGNVSPFLRTAQWIVLRGLSRSETEQLLHIPLALTWASSDILDTLWEQTNGHPLLLQAIMESAVEESTRVEEVASHIGASITNLGRGGHAGDVFPIWWDNLTERGQQLYQKLLQQNRPILASEQLQVLGARSAEHIEVLEATGIARRMPDHAILARGELFRRWFGANIGSGSDARSLPPDLPLGEATAFERELIEAVSRWTSAALEFAPFGLNNDGQLLPEAHFQMSLALSLVQRPFVVDTESWSMVGRIDLKVRLDGMRTCGEVNIWGGNNHRKVIEQLLGYMIFSDVFGFIVMISDQKGSLPRKCASEVLTGANRHWPLAGDGSAADQPVFVTRHDRDDAPSIRLYHFLLQLPPPRGSVGAREPS